MEAVEMIIPTNSNQQPATNVTAVPLLDVGRGNEPLKSEVMDTLSEIYDSCRFIGGPHCQNLEEMVAQVSDCEFGVGCASGSDALLLALMAVDLKPGDEVICPSFTFFATASAITRLGGVPVFVDIDPGTFNMNVDLIETLITEKTAAIIPVHLFGQCCDMDSILEIAQRNKIHVIEDCAQSIGATYNGRAAGSMGSVGCFSFYPTKNLGGVGDGGMLTTNDAALADRMRLLANHGMRPRYYHQEVGINSRLDSIQAAILSIKMKHLSEYSWKRQTNAANYDRLLRASGMEALIIKPVQDERCGHVWNQYSVRIPGGRRDEVRQALAEMNVGSEIYYPVPLHAQECFAYLGCKDSDLPETAKAATEVLALPIFPELTLAEQKYVVDCLITAIAAGSQETRRAA
jgi:dTDP-4-amino-4,6-dideoxygalactose transaminase